MMHPYAKLPADAFWRSAVAESDPATVTGIYRPAFQLTRDSAIATAGSCFAQHLGRALRAAGLRLLDAEPAPLAAALPLAMRYGFGLYSGRYGNIYTARQMVQLLEEVAAGVADDAHIWQRSGRFYDALRPAIEPGGLGSAAEVAAMRQRHIARLAPMLAQASHFVLTLGLTEGWACRRTGRVFPTAPGVVAGRIDSTRHEFVNFTYPQVLDDLIRIRALLQGFNPAMRLILTVSPVPLTATASGGHVLPATQYSKATLRAAAGDFVAMYDDADYFPAYEIVTNPAAKSAFFGADLRQVTPAGVLAVMEAFLTAHDLPRQAVQAQALPPGPAGDEEVICEEILLEALRP